MGGVWAGAALTLNHWGKCWQGAALTLNHQSLTNFFRALDLSLLHCKTFISLLLHLKTFTSLLFHFKSLPHCCWIDTDSLFLTEIRRLASEVLTSGWGILPGGVTLTGCSAPYLRQVMDLRVRYNWPRIGLQGEASNTQPSYT